MRALAMILVIFALTSLGLAGCPREREAKIIEPIEAEEVKNQTEHLGAELEELEALTKEIEDLGLELNETELTSIL